MSKAPLESKQNTRMADARSPQSVSSCRPFFLFGFERSGTTLLSMILGAHPRIAVPFSTTGLWYRYQDRLDAYDGLRTRASLERLVDDLLGEERIALWDAELRRDDVLRDLEPGRFAAVVDRFHRLYAAEKGKQEWGNSDIATLEHMDVARSWFPRARFIHLVRDGRDVALSHDRYPYGASNTLECAQEWRTQVYVNLKMGAILGPEHYLVVRYEDLLLESEDTLSRICRFLEVDYAPSMVDYGSMVDEKIPPSRRSLWPLIGKAPEKRNAYRWKREMSGTRRVVFEREARELLSRLGYETYSRLPRKPLSYGYELLCFLGRGHRFRRIVRALGILRVPRSRRTQGQEP